MTPGVTGFPCKFRAIRLALGTSDRTAAAIRAALLDAEFERLVVMGTIGKAGGAETLGEVLAAFRDHVVVWHETTRAAGPVRSHGVHPPPVELELRGDVVEEMSRIAEADDAMGAALPKHLAAAVREACAAKPSLHATPTVTSGARARAAAAVGRAGRFELAIRRNDIDLAEEYVERFEREKDLQLDPAVRPTALRYALGILAEAERVYARREMGVYPPPGEDPVLSLPATLRGADRSPAPVPRPADVAPAAPAASTVVTMIEGRGPEKAGRRPHAGQRVSDLVREKVAALQKKATTEKRGKLVRDWLVAGRLFVDLCGDLEPAQVTEEVARDFVELMARVPALHGKPGKLRGVTALQVIRWADDADAAALRDAVRAGREPEEAPKVARLSVATMNKHLTSLQSMIGKLLPRDAEGKTALTAARYSKSAVRQGATFDRRQLSDDRLQKIFHGPAFTGFSDDEKYRFVPGDRLIFDARYWVPLIGLFSGAREEEILELWACDFDVDDGVDCFQIGGIHDGKRVKVKGVPSVRKVPVHSALKRLGLMDFVRATKARGGKRLFLGFSRGGEDNRYGHDFSQWWTEYRREVGAYAKGQDFHSLRHGVNTRLLKKKKVPETIIRDILGHSQGESMTGQVYNSGMTLDDIAESLERLEYPALDLDLLVERGRRLSLGQ